MADGNELPTIDLAELQVITGGAGFDQSTMMMVVMMMMMRQQQPATAPQPVAPPPGDGWIRVA
jgi:hypothetical protein